MYVLVLTLPESFFVLRRWEHMSSLGTQIAPTLLREGSAPRFDPLPFYIPFLAEKIPLSYTLH